MKRILTILCALCVMQSSQALIVSVNGEGEVPAEGLEITITEAEENPLTGLYTMELKGELLTSASQITVRIIRSAAGLTDEFCCGNNCTAGNGQTEEQREFTVSGVTQWYTHYVPKPGSDETVQYVFDDGEESLEIRVRYTYAADGVEHTANDSSPATKQMHNGKVLIHRNGQIYTMTGATVK